MASMQDGTHSNGGRPRAGLMALLCLGVLLTSPGCVYWRLNQFRHQMVDFPSHFTIEEGAEAVITARKPVLQPDDLGWLTGLSAGQRTDEDQRVEEVYHYIKQYADPDQDEGGAYDLLFRLSYNDDGRLETIRVAAPFATLLTEDNFTEVFRSMKEGTDERWRQSTGWSWDEHRVTIPVRADIVDLFGTPYAVESSTDTLAYEYNYLLADNERRWNPTAGDVHIRFVFEPEEERVVFAESYKGRIFMQVDLRAERNQVELKRLGR